jgi:CRP-like cAMP-binding protein
MQYKREISCRTCRHRANNLFCRLGDSELDLLDRDKRTIQYGRGQILCHEGSPDLASYCIHSGSVQFYTTGIQGRAQGIRLAGPGELVSFLGMLCDKPGALSGKIVEKATVCIIPRTTFQTILSRSPAFMYSVLQKVASQLYNSIQQIASLGQESVRQRLARVISDVCEFSSVGRPNGQSIDLPLMRIELAELAGTTPESCSRVLSDMAGEQILQLTRKSITVRNLEALRRIADREPRGPSVAVA